MGFSNEINEWRCKFSKGMKAVKLYSIIKSMRKFYTPILKTRIRGEKLQ
jgi:hypothetical protein